MLPGVLDTLSENTKEIGFVEVQTFISLLKPEIFKAAKQDLCVHSQIIYADLENVHPKTI